MKKKIIVILLMSSLTIGMCSCGTSSKEVTNAPIESKTETNEIENSSDTTETTNIAQDNEEEDSLSKETKMEVLAYINGIMDPLNEDMSLSDEYLEEKANEVWKEAEEKFGVTEMDIMSILCDTDLVKEYYSKGYSQNSNSSVTTNKQSSDVITYDATLENDGYAVVVAATKDYMSEYIAYVTNNDTNAIQDMYLNGYIARVDSRTKVFIKDMGFSITKVKILEGELKDLEVYTINECIDMK